MRLIYFISCLLIASTTSLMGQMHGGFHPVEEFALDHDLYVENDEIESFLGHRMTYTHSEIEVFKRIYDEAHELLSDIGSYEFKEEYGPYATKLEVYCRDCASYIDIPVKRYNKYYMILALVDGDIDGLNRYAWLDHLSEIYKSGSDSWYGFYSQDNPSDSCEKYCKRHW